MPGLLLGSIHLQPLLYQYCITRYSTCSITRVLIHNVPFALDATTERLQTKGYNVLLETSEHSFQKGGSRFFEMKEES